MNALRFTTDDELRERWEEALDSERPALIDRLAVENRTTRAGIRDALAAVGCCKIPEQSEPAQEEPPDEAPLTLGEFRSVLTAYLPAALNEAELYLDGTPLLSIPEIVMSWGAGVPRVDVRTRRGK